MKLLFTLLALFFIPYAPVLAQSDWEIRSFHADIHVQENGTIYVKETIEAYFNSEKHGIYREIPTKYRNRFNQHISLGFDLIGVNDGQGNEHAYTVSRDGAYQNIRIGDPDVYVSGPVTYVIEYQAQRGLRYFNDHDELYWNATGTKWEVPITNSSATVYLPFESTNDVETICYTGRMGSTAQDCTADVQAGRADFTAQDYLTVAVSWPKGLVTEPSWFTKFDWFVRDNYGFALPLIALALGYYVWSNRGRDPKGRGIVRQYDAPDNLSPAEMDFLVHQRMKTDSLSAEIVWLANKGLLRIHEIEKKGLLGIKSTDYVLERTEKSSTGLKAHQDTLLIALFSDAVDQKIAVSDLPDDFYKTVSDMQKNVWDSIKARAYFAGKPENVMGGWIVAAMLIGFACFGLAIIYQMRLDMLVGAIVSGLIFLGFAFVMPKRTEAGVAAYQHALGFKQYIDGAETERVRWEEKQNLFFEVLPYAMIFGIAEKWAKVFEGKLQTPPDWYTGSNFAAFSPIHFNQSLSGFAAAASSHATPPSSSSSGFSGGSSGGGGGGGGGGSW